MLTDAMIRQTKAPKTGRKTLPDGKVAGLSLRITPSDARTWALFYRFKGDARLLTLGPYRPEGAVGDGLTLGQARKAAATALVQVMTGDDPQAAKVAARTAEAARARREGASFAGLAERWLAEGRVTKGVHKGKPWRSKTKAEFARIVNQELVPVLGDLEPAGVTKAMIRALYDRIEKRSTSVAQHVLAVLRMLLSWAAEEDRIDALPAFPRRGQQSTRRERVLEEAELRAVVTALDAGLSEVGVESSPSSATPRVDLMAEAFRLLLLTGQRRGEVLSMRWVDVTEEKGGAWWTIPAERFKGGRDHRVPLSGPAVESLKRLHTITGSENYVFPSPREKAKTGHVSNPQKAAGRLWAASKVKGATVHDLRRSCATFMVRLGVPRLVVGRVLGHADSDVTGRYDRHAYDAEKRSALTRWADELQRIVIDKQETETARVLPWADRR